MATYTHHNEEHEKSCANTTSATTTSITEEEKLDTCPCVYQHPIREALATKRNKLIERYQLLKKRIEEPHDTTDKSVSKQSKTGGVKRALLIGINYKGTSSELQGCVHDVEKIKAMLTSYYQYREEDIVMLTDRKRYSLKASRANILYWIKKMVADTQAGDELFVHYSGHGSQVKCYKGDEDKNDDTPGMDDVIIPCDFQTAYIGKRGMITDDELRIILVEAMVPGSKLRAFFDCCCSGTALDLPYVYKQNEKYALTYKKDGIQSTDCLLISGCRDDQTSADALIEKQYNGALTWALCKALETSRMTPISWKDLLLLVRTYLKESQFEQVPVLSVGAVSVAKTKVDL